MLSPNKSFIIALRDALAARCSRSDRVKVHDFYPIVFMLSRGAGPSAAQKFNCCAVLKMRRALVPALAAGDGAIVPRPGDGGELALLDRRARHIIHDT